MDNLDHTYAVLTSTHLVSEVVIDGEPRQPQGARDTEQRRPPSYSVASLYDGRTAHAAVFEPA